ncbi:MAG: TlpA family protein disulfide reductase, partial [Brevundimonas sp.]|uniref:TlpA family protein disulfide reductase n=1 Tax=Brevundimonas sp. TaxID=1871086 RepID=UPI0025C417FB
MGGSKWIAVIAGVVLLAGAGGLGLLYANKAGPFKGSAPAAARSEAKSDLARFAVGPLARLETPATLTPAPDHPFQDAEGREVRLADFRGRVVAVNLWAMWCAPCRT